jgi:cysteine desulfurase
MKPIYMDYSAATPMRPEVIEAMRPFWNEEFYNPSAIYLSAKAVKKQLEEARRRVAVQLGARPAEIVFTAGATEANNLAVQGVARSFPEGEMLISAIEHESVTAPAQLLGAKEIPVDGKGLIILNKLSNLLSDKTVLVSVILVNNEIGIIQPLAEVAKIVAEERRRRQSAGNKLPLYLHTDAAQAANYLDLHASRLGVDLMSLNGSKSYGPKQSGLLYIKAGTLIQPLIAGGGQEFNLRSGTENVAAIHGFTKALELAQAARHEESNRLSGLRKNLEEQIKADFPQATINGSPNHRAPHITSVTFDSVDNERLVMQLDERGIMCAVGSACSASSEEPSPVLRAIGLSERQARGTLRLSLGAGIGQPEIDKVVAVLRDLLINR